MAEYYGIDPNAVNENLAYDPNRYKATGSQSMDKNAFLKILVAQLQHQDPMAPMDDTQFISQMATFSSLEQMQQLNASFSQSQAFNLVGKLIYAEEGSAAFTGIVSSAGVADGEAYVLVGESRIKLDSIKQVFDSSSITGKDLLEGAAIIGKYIQYKEVVVEDGKAVEKRSSGKVERIDIGPDGMTMLVNGKNISFMQVEKVSDSEIVVETVQESEEAAPEDGETP